MGELDEILTKKFTSSFRHGYTDVRGVTLPLRYLDLQNEIDNWEVNEEDIWICSYPKTGTTWAQEMIWLIANDLNFKEAQENLGARSPFLEVSALFDFRDMMKNNKDFKPPPFLVDSINFIKNQNHPVCIKTHLPWQLLPKSIQSGKKKPKIIYVTRNSKDTCISYFHHVRNIEGFRGNFEEFSKLFLAGKVCFGNFWNHVLQFWRKRNEPNILFLKYENMKKDLPNNIKKVADFLGKPLTVDQVEKLTNHLSFESMKNNPAVNYELVLELNKKFKLTEGDGKFMRSGTVGGFKAEMDKDTIKKIDNWNEKHLKNTDFVL